MTLTREPASSLGDASSMHLAGDHRNPIQAARVSTRDGDGDHRRISRHTERGTRLLLRRGSSR